MIIRGTHKKTPFEYDIAWIDQVGNFDYIDIMGNLYIKLILSGATGVYNVGTQLKTVYDMALKTNPNIIPSFTNNSKIPKNISLNLNKLKKIL